ncbi:hypothetical protein FFT12_00200, partial [Wolbachia endosymbiont of Drosophila teissieri]
MLHYRWRYISCWWNVVRNNCAFTSVKRQSAYKLTHRNKKNFLDKLRQPPYHETEAIYLSSLYRLNDKKTHV